MSRYTLLPDRERLAVQAVLVRMYEELHTDQAVATKVGISQQAVNKARVHAVVGPGVANALYAHMDLTRDAFMKKYAAPEDTLILEATNPVHYAAMVRAIGRSMVIPALNVDGFLEAAMRHGSVPIERVPAALEAFLLTQSEAVHISPRELAWAERRTTPKLRKRRS